MWKDFSANLICNYCKEHVSWICNKCQRVEDVSHKHDRTSESHEDTYLNFRDPIENDIIIQLAATQVMHCHKLDA